jgi:hypothetical protein
MDGRGSIQLDIMVLHISDDFMLVALWIDSEGFTRSD